MKPTRTGALPPRPHQRIQSLDVGVESIARWRIDDEQHLPDERKQAPAFLPETRALDSILRRPSLDERLPDLLKPDHLDPDLLLPARLSAMRRDIAGTFRSLQDASGDIARRAAFQRAADVMDDDVELDHEVRAALALLLRG